MRRSVEIGCFKIVACIAYGPPTVACGRKHVRNSETAWHSRWDARSAPGTPPSEKPPEGVRCHLSRQAARKKPGTGLRS
jgi:hypothetical protein